MEFKMNELLNKLDSYQKRVTGSYSVAYGGFKIYPHSVVSAADGGNGGGYVFETYTNRYGEPIPIGAYAGEEGDFFNGCTSLGDAIDRAMAFCSTEDFVSACKMAAAGDAMGAVVANRMFS